MKESNRKNKQEDNKILNLPRVTEKVSKKEDFPKVENFQISKKTCKKSSFGRK